MSLLEMQRAFSRILTDKDFQREFLADDPGAHAEYQLTEKERDSLRGMRRDNLALHTTLLGAGRLELGLKALPLSAELLHESLYHGPSDLTDRFCAEYPPRPEAEGGLIVTANRVAAFLTPLIAAGTLSPPWAAELLVYELALLNLGATHAAWAGATAVAALNARPPAPASQTVPVAGRHVQVAEFWYPIPDVYGRLKADEPPGPVQALDRPILVLFHKVPDTIEVRTFRVNRPTADLIGACDGRRTAEEVLDLLGTRYPDPSARAGASAALARLAELGILGLDQVGAGASGKAVETVCVEAPEDETAEDQTAEDEAV